MLHYNPLELSRRTYNLVARFESGVEARRYVRFRRDKWYGGCVTGDLAGCNLRCRFCWAYKIAWGCRGVYLKPIDAWEKIKSRAKGGVRRARVSGGEPTITMNHLKSLIELAVNDGFEFILETNGVLIGLNEGYARLLAGFGGCGVEVRVSIKGCSPNEFYKLTGADPRFWWSQVRALELLVNEGLRPCEEVYPAVMLSFSTSKSYESLKSILARVDSRLKSCIDEEYVIMYPHVKRLLKVFGLEPKRYYYPNNIPEFMI